MKIIQHNYKENDCCMSNGGKILTAKTQLIDILDDVERITKKVNAPQTRFYGEELTRIDVYEKGIVLTFEEEEESYHDETYTVESKAYIFDDGRIHYIFTELGFDAVSIKDLATKKELDKEMGKKIELVPSKTKIVDKIKNTEKRNKKIGELCKAKVSRLLEKTKKFLSEDKELIDHIVEHLDDNDVNWNTEMMVTVIKNEFAEFGDKLTDDIITSAVISHMQHGGKTITESFEFEETSKKRKIS